MEVSQMRAKIIKVYPGERWRNKVSKMSDDQVIAIYHRFLYSGKFKEVK